MSLEGLTCLVTGASRGIGKGVAEVLKAKGANIVISGTNEESLKKVADELEATYVVANLSQASGVEKLIAEAGDVDVLVNNAGITKDGLFQRISEDDWNAVLTVNMMATINLSKAFAQKMMKKKFGRIINITSVVAHMGNVGQSNYITSKAAVTGFSKALSLEVARRGVTVNCVAPGFIQTDMTNEMSEKAVEEMASKIPSKKLGEVADIANAVAYLASREAGYVTGTTLHVNGGLYL
ncbi:MAG: beta-ketoacyl-ACP reductase [Magnetococcales bacterium]|nr:beta-ketoacyl-ACP reductase [Magnetococcales bacterium]PPR18391.1 MAG: 3-oxoacyl-[acyl-carrier-protein] reductase FabG [Pseudomonadota bacterium]